MFTPVEVRALDRAITELILGWAVQKPSRLTIPEKFLGKIFSGMTVGDNLAEFTATAVLSKSSKNWVVWRDIALGKPMQAAFCESYNRYNC